MAMIYSLSGTIRTKQPNFVVLEVSGVGFGVKTTLNTTSKLGREGEQGFLYTHLNVREDALELYGFAQQSELECFLMLISISGVGPKAALAVLSVMTPEKVALAASSGDHKAFTKASGVGPKLAQRIALELKDKVGKGLAMGTGFADAGEEAPAAGSAPSQAVAALVALGYNASDAARAVSRVDDTLPVQDIIKIALRGLSKL